MRALSLEGARFLAWHLNRAPGCGTVAILLHGVGAVVHWRNTLPTLIQEADVPIIRIDGPPIADNETRRKLVRGLTEVVHDTLGIDTAHITVVIRENRPENIGSGGELLIDKFARRDKSD